MLFYLNCLNQENATFICFHLFHELDTLGIKKLTEKDKILTYIINWENWESIWIGKIAIEKDMANTLILEK